MTNEELRKLKPGDKVVLNERYRKDHASAWKVSFKIQDENGGALTVKSNNHRSWRPIKIKEVPENYRFEQGWVELYKPRPWSYELDY